MAEGGNEFLFGLLCGGAAMYVIMDFFGCNKARYPTSADVKALRLLIRRATGALVRSASDRWKTMPPPAAIDEEALAALTPQHGFSAEDCF